MYFLVFYFKNNYFIELLLDRTKIIEGGDKEMLNELTQESVRKKYAERLVREKQTYISKVTGIPASVLSEFKLGKKVLYDSSLEILNDYLDNH